MIIMNEEKKYKVGIVPGSFDPITNGHINIIRRAARLCEKVYVAVMINDQKKYLFTLEERRKIAEAACSDIKNAEVISSGGMLWMLARDLDAQAIIKGVRNETDRAYELEMAKYNSEHYPKAETVLLDAAEELCDLSSTLVRDRIAHGASIGEQLPEKAVIILEEIIKNKYKGENI